MRETLPVVDPDNHNGMTFDHPQHLTLKEYQKQAIAFALDRRSSYLALQAGLGKTPIAAVIQNHLDTPTLYVCPPFLVQNTKHEFNKWSPHTTVWTERNAPYQAFATVWIMPDSLIFRDDVFPEIVWWLKHYAHLKPTLISDEHHRNCNSTTKRAKALFALTKHFAKHILLSGTPMPNRPMELYNALHNYAPQTIGNMTRQQYGERYCNARFDPIFQRYDFSGASNMEELASRVQGTFMLRMRKADVLTELPDKIEEQIVIGKAPKALADQEHKILSRYSAEDLMQNVIKANIGLGEDDPLHIATYRRELGIHKATFAAEYIANILDSNQPVLVFAVHKDVILSLTESLARYSPLVITGQTPTSERQAIVQTFQTSPKHNLFIGNIQAAGTGFTLTKASRVVFVEFSWVPGDNDQAASRAHRMGQKDCVLVQYLLFENSLDEKILAALKRKQGAIDKL